MSHNVKTWPLHRLSAEHLRTDHLAIERRKPEHCLRVKRHLFCLLPAKPGVLPLSDGPSLQKDGKIITATMML